MNPQEINPNPNQINQDPNINQINTNTEPNNPVQPAMTPSVQPPVQPSSTTDVLGILSLVAPFVGLAVIGLILGIIGIKKAKNEGRSTTLSKIGIILNTVVIVIISLLFIIGMITGFNNAKNNAEKTSDTTGSYSSLSTESAEQKADELIEIQRTSNPFKPSADDLAQAQEIDTYAKYIDQPNLSAEERRQEGFKIGGTLGVYNELLTEGTIEKTVAETISNNSEYVVVKYNAENPNASAFQGPYEISVYTAYIDGAWRIVDFQVKPI